MSRLKTHGAPAKRWGLAVIAMTGALASVVHCGSDTGDTEGTGGKTSTTTTGSTTGVGGNGGGGSGTGGSVSSKLSSATPVAVDAAHSVAFDATLSNDGSIVYFTGLGPSGPGVYSVPVAGGTVTKILEGSPFAAPFGIVLSTDGKKLFVADPGAEGTSLDHGRILAVDPEQGTITPIMAADDTSPRALDVVSENGVDQIYYSGITQGVPAIFKVDSTGAGATKVIASGAPLLDPQALAVDKAGKIYVVDAIGSKTGRANVMVFNGTTFDPFVTDLSVGYPCGIALGLDEKSLYVSSLDTKKGASSLLVLDIFSKEPSSFPTDGSLDTQFEPGGLHRARAAQKFAWVSVNPAGSSILLVK